MESNGLLILNFVSAISDASEYNFTLKSDSSTFWSGIGDEGICNGDQIAANCADKMGRSTLETTLSSKGIELPNWDVSNPSTISAGIVLLPPTQCILQGMWKRYSEILFDQPVYGMSLNVLF